MVWSSLKNTPSKMYKVDGVTISAGIKISSLSLSKA